MANPTSVNDQVTDSVTQANTQVIGEAPAMAMGSLYQSMSHSLAMSGQNAVFNQQQFYTLNEATTTSCVEQILGKKLHKKQ